MIEIKLRREWQGQDSWGAFIEEVAIDSSTQTLRYRRSTGGNCEYGQWQAWESEKTALNFILGPIKASVVLRASLFKHLSKLPTLPEAVLSTGHSYTNYGAY